MNQKIQSYKRGVWAEYFAVVYLFFCGYRVLSLRYKTPVGEIDILAQRANVLVAIEVKARADKASALESVTPKNQKRVEQALLHFISHNTKYAAYEMRFDVVIFERAFGWPFRLTHLDNAWQARS